MDHWEIPAHAFEAIHHLIEETVKTYYWTPEISLGSPYKCVQIKILQTMCKVLKGCGNGLIRIGKKKLDCKINHDIFSVTVWMALYLRNL